VACQVVRQVEFVKTKLISKSLQLLKLCQQKQACYLILILKQPRNQMIFLATRPEPTAKTAICRRVQLAIQTSSNDKAICRVLQRVISLTYHLEFKITRSAKHFKVKAIVCKYSGRYKTIIMKVN
jgi:hypothetical protein